MLLINTTVLQNKTEYKRNKSSLGNHSLDLSKEYVSHNKHVPNK